MATCDAQVFSGITQARFACLVQTASAKGISISGNQGQAVVSHSIGSATISWDYDPATQTLTLQCLDRSFGVTCGRVNNMLHDLVDSCP
jgi:hypothetical protein